MRQPVYQRLFFLRSLSPYQEESNYDARERSPSTKAIAIDRQQRKGREHEARGLKTSTILIRLRDSDLAGLDVLGFGQSQRDETLIDLRADFVAVD